MTKKILITGSLGLVGSEAVRYFIEKHDYEVVGFDCDKRKEFFGSDASTSLVLNELNQYINYSHEWVDLTDVDYITSLINEYDPFDFILHTAAQPSHDYAARDPFGDFHSNATATLGLLEALRYKKKPCVFINVSTNKVYGDRPNSIPLIETDTRWVPNWELLKDEIFPNMTIIKGLSAKGITEDMSIDQCTHSLFGVSKAYGDLITQEYGRYFPDIFKTAVFRGGCLTGTSHKGTELHGFLSFLVKCFVHKNKYTVFGYKGKQVRDNIHAYDLIRAFDCFFQNPKNTSPVYNIGGGEHSNISMIEAIEKLRFLTDNNMEVPIIENNRIGDHIWYVSDVSKFRSDYPEWNYTYDIDRILEEMVLAEHEKISE